MTHRIFATILLAIVFSPLAHAQGELRLTAPNGGERLHQGDTVTIRWEGVPESEPVAIELSEDAGQSWTPIALHVTGLRWAWKITQPVNASCMMRVVKLADQANYSNVFRQEWEAVTSASINRDGTRLLTTSGRGPLLWDLTRKLAVDSIPIDSVESECFPCSDGDFNHTGSRIVTTGQVHAVISDVLTGKKVRALPVMEPTMSVRFSPNSTQVVTGTAQGARVWNAANGDSVITFVKSRPGPVTTMSWHPDGLRVLLLGFDEFHTHIEPRLTRTFHLRGPAGAYSPDGKTVATSEWGRVQILDLASGQLLFVIPGSSTRRILEINFSPDGKRIVTRSRDRFVHVIDVATGNVLRTIYGTAEFLKARFSPDGRYLATGALDSTARVWDLFAPPLPEDRSDALFEIAPAGPSGVTHQAVAGSTTIEAFPDPAGDVVTLRYAIDHPAHIRLRAFDAAGTTVAILVDQPMDQGMQTIRWENRMLPAGVYHLLLEIDGVASTRTVRIVR